MMPLTDAQNRILDLLYDILRRHPEGMKEFDLLAILQGRGLPIFSELDYADPLALFRTHFMLFHLLYRLSERLDSRREGTLDIHCLQIVLHPWRSIPQSLPERFDSLRQYYLELRNLEETTRAEVEELLDDFWRRYLHFDRRPQHLAALGLNEPVSRQQIKKRFRQLALRHHPDRGGNPERFLEISRAAEGLLA